MNKFYSFAWAEEKIMSVVQMDNGDCHGFSSIEAGRKRCTMGGEHEHIFGFWKIKEAKS